MSSSYCAVAQCSNSLAKSRKKGIRLSFHKFPRDERRKTWVNRCKRSNSFNPDTSYICSDHFDEVKDFEVDMRAKIMGGTARRLLKPTALPHLKLPSSMENVSSARYLRAAKRESKPEKNLNLPAMTFPSTSTRISTNISEIENIADFNLCQTNEESSDIISKQQAEIDNLKRELKASIKKVSSLEEEMSKYSGINYIRVNHFLQLFE